MLLFELAWRSGPEAEADQRGRCSKSAPSIAALYVSWFDAGYPPEGLEFPLEEMEFGIHAGVY